ncbi:hypothetical protein BG011_005587 [Mortierella polycephala]|uniref:Uncharacterized protein n=1 Tax=Mortierella polycephala TaxID=41804 RepID=A0A9P6U9A8_9FUNG|nr:hypothetical protein BG011_005587 [Mortierella polycephala]
MAFTPPITFPTSPFHSLKIAEPITQKSPAAKRRVRFTFGYQRPDSRRLSTASLPPSPSGTFTFSDAPAKSSSPLITSTSLSSVDPTKYTAPASTCTASPCSTPSSSSEIRSSIPVRSSSITASTFSRSTSPAFFAPSRSTSRCKAHQHNYIAFTGSLDHRTMTRSHSTVKRTRSVSSASSTSTATSSAATFCPPSTSASTNEVNETQMPLSTDDLSSPSEPLLATKSNTVNERSAFLTSAPVRSRVQITPRFKNATPILITPSLSSPSATITTGSSSTSAKRCIFHFGVNLEKRRWSNDSTRGLHGAPSLFLSNPAEYTDLENDEQHRHYSYDNDNSNDNDNKQKKVMSKKKRRCPTLALFSFMLRK